MKKIMAFLSLFPFGLFAGIYPSSDYFGLTLQPQTNAAGVIAVLGISSGSGTTNAFYPTNAAGVIVVGTNIWISTNYDALGAAQNATNSLIPLSSVNAQTLSIGTTNVTAGQNITATQSGQTVSLAVTGTLTNNTTGNSASSTFASYGASGGNIVTNMRPGAGYLVISNSNEIIPAGDYIQFGNFGGIVVEGGNSGSVFLDNHQGGIYLNNDVRGVQVFNDQGGGLNIPTNGALSLIDNSNTGLRSVGNGNFYFDGNYTTGNVFVANSFQGNLTGNAAVATNAPDGNSLNAALFNPNPNATNTLTVKGQSGYSDYSINIGNTTGVGIDAFAGRNYSYVGAGGIYEWGFPGQGPHTYYDGHAAISYEPMFDSTLNIFNTYTFSMANDPRNPLSGASPFSCFIPYIGGSVAGTSDQRIYPVTQANSLPVKPFILTTWTGDTSLALNQVLVSNIVSLAVSSGLVAAVTNAGVVFMFHVDDNCSIWTNTRVGGRRVPDTTQYPSFTNLVGMIHSNNSQIQLMFDTYGGVTNLITLSYVPSYVFPISAVNNIRQDIATFYTLGIDSIRISDTAGVGFYQAVMARVDDAIQTPSWPSWYAVNAEDYSINAFKPMSVFMYFNVFSQPPRQLYQMANGFSWDGGGAYPFEPGFYAGNLMRNELKYVTPYTASWGTTGFINGDDTAANIQTEFGIRLMLNGVVCVSSHTNASNGGIGPNTWASITNKLWLAAYADTSTAKPWTVYDNGVSNAICLARQLSTGQLLVYPLNESNGIQSLTFTWQGLRLPKGSSYDVTSIWEGIDFGIYNSSFTSTNSPAQYGRLYVLTPRFDVVTGNGSGLTNLNASAITTGTLPAAQLPAGVVTNGAVTYTVLANTNGVGTTGTASVLYGDFTGSTVQVVTTAGRSATILFTNNWSPPFANTNYTVTGTMSPLLAGAQIPIAFCNRTPSNFVVFTGSTPGITTYNVDIHIDHH